MRTGGTSLLRCHRWCACGCGGDGGDGDGRGDAAGEDLTLEQIGIGETLHAHIPPPSACLSFTRIRINFRTNSRRESKMRRILYDM